MSFSAYAYTRKTGAPSRFPVYREAKIEKPQTHERGLFVHWLDDQLNPKHELFRLAQAMDWQALIADVGPLYADQKGRSGIPIRTIAGIVMLQHTFGLSDEEVVVKWIENPYWSHRNFLRLQFFCGEAFFQHDLPISPSSVTRWRIRIGKEGVERLLALTIEAGKRTKTIKAKELEIVIVDTTVQPKAVEHPTDARLYVKALHTLVRIAKRYGIKLCQIYTSRSGARIPATGGTGR